MKKLLHITEAMAGGVLVFLADLNRYLKGKYEIVIAYGVRNNTPENLREYFDDDVKLIRLEELTNRMNPKQMLSGWKAIKRVMAKERADVIHFHSSAAGILGRMGQCYYGADVFYTPHSYFFQNPEINPVKGSLFYLIEKGLAYTPTVTVACGMGEYELAKRISHKSKCIENGIDIKFIDDISLKDEADTSNRQQPSIYASGRICQHKNPYLFNEIAKALPDYKFVWIGDGEDREMLTASNIEITGHISHAQAIKKAMECKVFLLTSTYEGLPLSLLEAMYMKRISVVNQIDGIKGLMVNRENGYVCGTGDEMVERIRQIMEGKVKEELDVILNHAKESVVTRYSASHMAEKYCRLYEGMDVSDI